MQLSGSGGAMADIDEDARREKSLGPWLGLTFSKRFFQSFPVHEDRVKQWRLIYSLVRQGKTELTRKELNVVLDSGHLGNEHVLVTKLLFDLQSKDCIVLKKDDEKKDAPTLEPAVKTDVDEMSVQTRIVLDGRFYEKIQIYVGAFVLWLLPNAPVPTSEQSRDLMKKIYEFQMLVVNPKWNLFVLALADRAAENPNLKVDSDEFRRDVAESSEHWLGLHWLLAKHLEMEDPKWSIAEIHHFISDEVTTFVKEPKLRAAINFLNACGVLATSRRKKEKVYNISPAFWPTFAQYDQDLIALRNELIKKIRPTFGMPSEAFE
jgi:hypothetical protein